MARRRRTREESSGDRWVVSYADFITLLLAFFVVMYSISSINEGKYRVLSETLHGVFKGQDRTFDPIAVGDIPERLDRRDIGLLGQQPALEASRNQVLPNRRGDISENLARIEDDARLRYQELIDEGALSISSNELWLEIEIGSNLLFTSGKAEPGIEADALLEALAEILRPYENPVHVEGFTDNQPVQGGEFASNWELSAARSAAVVRALAHYGVDPVRMAAVGYGEYKPVVSNLTARGRAKNRRVVIIVSRDEQVRRSVMGYGSAEISDSTVDRILQQKLETPVQGRVVSQETPAGGVLFTREVAPDSGGEVVAPEGGQTIGIPLDTVPEDVIPTSAPPADEQQ